MKARIGITPQYDNYLGNLKISPFYSQAIEQSGGIPFILPYTRDQKQIEEIVDSLDGVLFSGGTNISPARYGESAQENCGDIEFERDMFELALCKNATEKNKSILGICRGCQLIAVSAGGSLIQHIENHNQLQDKHISSHTVEISKDSLLFDILNTEKTDVNSFHHQAIKNTGALKACAFGLNNTVEAVYLQNQKFHLGIQWHPERMYSTNIHAKLIFDRFVSSCL